MHRCHIHRRKAILTETTGVFDICAHPWAQEMSLHSLSCLEFGFTWRRVTAILYWAEMVAWALMSAPRDWSLASARKASSKQDNASESWFCSRWAIPVLKQTDAAAPRGTCYKETSKGGEWRNLDQKKKAQQT